MLKKSQQMVFNELSDVDAGKLIKGIFNYVNYGDGELDGYLKVIFIPIKSDIDENEENYRKRCAINKINGSKGGASKGNNNAKKGKQPKTTERLQKQPKTSKNNMNNHISYITNHLEEKKIIGVWGKKRKRKPLMRRYFRRLLERCFSNIKTTSQREKRKLF